MKKTKLGLIMMSATLTLALAACGSGKTNEPGASGSPGGNTSSPSSNAKPITIKLGHGTSNKSLYHIGSEKFKEVVEAKTNGQIKVEIHTDGTIGHDNDLVNFLKTGNVQMGMLGVEPLTSIEPKFKLINLPYIFPDRNAAYTVLDGKIGAEIAGSLPDKHGLRILAYFENGFRNVSNSKREILTPADLKGLKIRTPQSPVSLSSFKALGANPTPMNFGELYGALEQKTVDGQENPLALFYTNNLQDVQKFVSITNHIYSPMVLAISEKTWKQLSPEQQAIVQAAANEARDYERKISSDEEEGYIKMLEKDGVKVSKPDLAPFIQATKDVHLEFDAEYGADLYQRVLAETQK